MSKKSISQNQLTLFTGEPDTSTSPFDAIRHFDDNGQECWYARELMKALEYVEWRNFKPSIARAKTSCEKNGKSVDDHFVQQNEAIIGGKGARQNVDSYKLSRYACYLIAMNGDPEKGIVAQAQDYFADQARKQEITQAQALLKRNQKVTQHVIHGKSQSWAGKRITSSETQTAINGGLLATHVDRKPDFGKVAQIQNRELFNMTRNEIVAELGLTAAQANKYRDHLGEYALEAITLVNKASLRQMNALGRALTTDEQSEIVRVQAKKAAAIMRVAAEMDGTDFLSGAELDENGNALIQRQRPLLPRGKSQ